MEINFYISSMIPSGWRPLPPVALNKAKFVLFHVRSVGHLGNGRCALCSSSHQIVFGDQYRGEGDEPRITDTSLSCTFCVTAFMYSARI